MIWTDLAFGLRYMGLNLGKNEFGLQFFLVGPRFRPRIGPKSGWPKWGPTGRVWAPGKKNPFNKQTGSEPLVGFG